MSSAEVIKHEFDVRSSLEDWEDSNIFSVFKALNNKVLLINTTMIPEHKFNELCNS